MNQLWTFLSVAMVVSQGMFAQVIDCHGLKKLVSEWSDVADRFIATSEYFDLPRFSEIYRNPAPYSSCASDLLLDKELSPEAKRILVYLFQSLKPDEYVIFLNDVIAAVDRGSLDADLLQRAFFPGLEWNTVIAIDFEKKEVVELLNRFIALPQVSETYRQLARDVLSGKAKLEVQELQEAGQIPKRIQ